MDRGGSRPARTRGRSHHRPAVYRDCFQRPLIVRVNEVGKAVPVGYEWDFKPQANEVKFFMTQFSQAFFGRSHNPNLPLRYAQSYAFLSPDFFHKQSAYDEQTHGSLNICRAVTLT
jgi:hypothetical protein